MNRSINNLAGNFLDLQGKGTECTGTLVHVTCFLLYPSNNKEPRTCRYSTRSLQWRPLLALSYSKACIFWTNGFTLRANPEYNHFQLAGSCMDRSQKLGMSAASHSSAVALAHHCKPAGFSRLLLAHSLHSKRLSTMKAETNKQGNSFTFRGSKRGPTPRCILEPPGVGTYAAFDLIRFLRRTRCLSSIIA